MRCTRANLVFVFCRFVPHFNCTTYVFAFAVPSATSTVCTHAIVHGPLYRPLEIVGEQALVSLEPGSGIRPSVVAAPVDGTMASQVGDGQTQETIEEADTGPAVTAKKCQQELQQSPTVGQTVAKQSEPVALGDDLGADGVDARPTEGRVLTGVAVAVWESGRSGNGGVRSSEEENQQKEQPDVGSMVCGMCCQLGC